MLVGTQGGHVLLLSTRTGRQIGPVTKVSATPAQAVALALSIDQRDRPADERYVKVASGRDYGDIRPVSGTYRGGKTRSLLVDVRLRESEAAGATH